MFTEPSKPKTLHVQSSKNSKRKGDRAGLLVRGDGTLVVLVPGQLILKLKP